MGDGFCSGWPAEANWLVDDHHPLPVNDSNMSEISSGLSSSLPVPWGQLPTQPDLSMYSYCANNSSGFEAGVSSWSAPPVAEYEGVDHTAAEVICSKSQSHSQAEKRRRDRINAQLARLRKNIPKSDKMDKAALLATTIDHLKDLKSKAYETNKYMIIPSEIDEVVVECDLGKEVVDQIEFDSSSKNSRNNTFIRATICCEDRPELYKQITKALKCLKITIVRADIACLGGRVKSIFILCINYGASELCLDKLKQSLKTALSRIVSFSSTSNCLVTTRRQRLLFNAHY